MISIAMTTYNGGRYLREQLDSILTQTFNDFELIVCDDCSKDDTCDILEEYAKKDRRIIIHHNEKNIGFLANFEKAISLCQGDFIALSDQDDIWYPNHLELLYKNIGNNLLAVGNSMLINAEGEKIMDQKYQMGIDIDYENGRDMAITLLFFRNWMQGASMMLSKNFVVDALPIPNGAKYHDTWFALLASLNNSIAYIDEPITQYRQHGYNASSKHKVRRNKFLIWLKHLLVGSVLADRLPMVLAVKEQKRNTYERQKDILDNAIKYYKRQKHLYGRILNMCFEMKYLKKIYSINK